MRVCKTSLGSHGPLAKLLLTGLLLLIGSPVWACSVPVFRYALEHWQADPYQVVFFHRGELTTEQESLLTRLSRSGKAGKISANVEVFAVDLDQAKPDDPRSKDDLALWKEQNTETLPWLVVRYPLSIPNPKIIWAGEPTEAAIDLLLESPKRKEICNRILKGDTAVWVFLDGGNKETDDAAFLRLTSELKRCESEMQLPAPDPQDVADGLISVDQATLQLRFSTLRISRDDPKEARFIDMLLDMEPDLRDEEYAGEPMAFPIFGRGRALSFVIGKGIDRDVISSDCRFLVGPCSCQVKQQNPGTDLLMAVDWDRLVLPNIEVDQSLPPLPVIGSVPAANESAEPQTSSKTEPTPKSETNPNKAEPNDDAPAETEDTVAAATKEASAPKAVGSRVLMTTLICLGAAIAGIAVMSVILVKS